MSAALCARSVLSVGLFAAAFFASPALLAETTDDWWGRDKALHFGVSAGLGAAGYGASSLLFERRLERAAGGAVFSLTLGAAKELHDLSGSGDASWKDFTWDVAGTAVGVGIALLVDLALAPEKSEPLPRTAAIRF
jgi:putative lipoprotein